MTPGAWLTLLPFVLLVVGAFLVYLFGYFSRLGNRAEAVLTSVLLVLTMLSLFIQRSVLIGAPSAVRWQGVVLAAPEAHLAVSMMGVVVILAACIVGIFVCLYSAEYLSRDPRHGLYYPLILLLLAGLLGMFYITDLFSLFILAELTTITASGLTAFRFNQAAAVRAGFKYLVMSSLGTLVMLLGIYLIFRETAQLDLAVLAQQNSSVVSVGAVCIGVGFCIKAGVVPLHGWVPEVYANAPSAVSGLFAGITSKAMLFLLPGICLRLNLSPRELGLFLLAFSAANMLVGALHMLTQQNLRRFLAFSAITHTGYLMYILAIHFLYGVPGALTAAIFTFFSIALMKAMAFLCVGMYEYRLDVKTLAQLRGGYWWLPFPAACFSIALAGLAGIPLFAGFIGKWMIYSAAIQTGDPFVLAGFAVFLISSILALIAYLTLLIRQFQTDDSLVDDTPADSRPAANLSWWMKIPVALLAVLVVVLGILPSGVLDSITELAKGIPF